MKFRLFQQNHIQEHVEEKLSVEEIDENFKNKDIIIVEDIIDSGATIKEIYSRFNSLGPISIKVVTLLHKNIAKNIEDIDLITAFEIENKFVIGYGLDYNNLFRNLKGYLYRR